MDKVEVDGLAVALRRELKIAALRYFDPQGTFVAAARRILGGPLPQSQRAIQYPHIESQAALMLAWRSPTETLLLSADEAAFAAVSNALGAGGTGGTDGCVVDQSGGLWAWGVGGVRAPELLLRLGSTDSVPATGEARSSRLAELPVLALCVEPGHILLVAERVYAGHLHAWIRETAADL